MHDASFDLLFLYRRVVVWVGGEALTPRAAADKAAAAAALGDEHALPPSSADAATEVPFEPPPHPFDAVVDDRCANCRTFSAFFSCFLHLLCAFVV